MTDNQQHSCGGSWMYGDVYSVGLIFAHFLECLLLHGSNWSLTLKISDKILKYFLRKQVTLTWGRPRETSCSSARKLISKFHMFVSGLKGEGNANHLFYRHSNDVFDWNKLWYLITKRGALHLKSLRRHHVYICKSKPLFVVKSE